MNWLILSLIALLFWSGSDFFSKVGTDQKDPYSHWKMVFFVGLIMGGQAIVQLIVGSVSITFQDILKYLPASFLYIASMAIGYVALRYVELSLSTPVCNASGAVAAIFCFIFLREEIGGLTLAGIVVVSLGVLLLGIVESTEDEEVRIQRQMASNRKYTKSILALLLPILYCVLDAAGTVADAVILEDMDENVANTAYGLTFLFVGLLSFIYVYIIKKEKIVVKYDGYKLVGGACEAAGQVAYIYALASYSVGAAPVISSYCMLSILWSRLFLKEKLTWKHYGCILLVIIGIVILGISEGIAE